MAATAGDLIEITYNHPSLGTGTIFAKSNEDSTFDLGGFRSEDDANMIDGGGRMINKLNRVRWSLETTVVWDMNETSELERVSELAANPLESDWTFTHASGAIYKGKGVPVGDYQGNGNAATFTLKISGGGTLRKIAG